MSDNNGTQATNTADANELQTLQEKNDRLYGQFVDLKKQLESYTKLGAVDDLKGRLEDYEGLRKNTAKTPEEIDRLISDKEKEFERRFGGKFEQLETENSKLKSSIQKYEVVMPTMQKAAAIFRDTELELVNMLVERDLGLQDGKIIVKGADGKPLVSAKDPRQNMTVDEYLENLSAKYPGIAKPRTVGTGKDTATTSNGAVAYIGNLPTPAELLQMTPEQIKAKGFTADQLKQIMG
jgi:hypothetical protein